MKFPDVFVGKRLFLGLGKPELLGRGEKEVRRREEGTIKKWIVFINLFAFSHNILTRHHTCLVFENI